MEVISSQHHLLGGNGSFNYSKTISYTQKSYVSEVEQAKLKKCFMGRQSKRIHYATESGQKSAL
ncbi:leukocidin family pore-forming toxin [Staphylococcus aureus]|uniref:leukocidin family pore-forming toxin n=1 Tax=Staphylococcus aureus TaxID=1280 RepID=UPI003248F8D8